MVHEKEMRKYIWGKSLVVVGLIVYTACDRSEPGEVPWLDYMAEKEHVAQMAEQQKRAEVDAILSGRKDPANTPPSLNQNSNNQPAVPVAPKKDWKAEYLASGGQLQDHTLVDCQEVVDGTLVCYNDILKVLSDDEKERAPKEYDNYLQPFVELCHKKNAEQRFISVLDWENLGAMWYCIRTLSGCSLDNAETKINLCVEYCPKPHCD